MVILVHTIASLLNCLPCGILHKLCSRATHLTFVGFQMQLHNSRCSLNLYFVSTRTSRLELSFYCYYHKEGSWVTNMTLLFCLKKNYNLRASLNTISWLAPEHPFGIFVYGYLHKLCFGANQLSFIDFRKQLQNQRF